MLWVQVLQGKYGRLQDVCSTGARGIQWQPDGAMRWHFENGEKFSLQRAYCINGEMKNDLLAMYAGDIMTVNVNLGGLPVLVLPCGFVKDGSSCLPIGL
ncbi:hypothetical protein M9H77_08179 [Catharanthus roseus]|uniref:Uncharacterized protein n=1 Tax=Catharanthus roseus TaxID=4058 RepID=A0ACC0BX91_CATRO|nr:hypothetical protein M9H77_08179 [Catharanthus roseus]